MANTSGRILGIDLGTTFSAMAYLDRHGTPVTIPNAEGELTTPSAVLFDPGGTVVVGREARRACLVHPDRVATCVKRDMGEKYYSRPILGRQMAPSAIAALILKKLRQDAEQRIGPVAGVVITVPAYFDEARRQATVDAGTIAGFNVIDIINEPTSAALAYALGRFLARGGKIDDAGGLPASAGPSKATVYDLGGGTFDVTILQISGDDLRVLATEGDVRLGGKDWDERIVNYAAELFIQQHGSDPRSDPQSHQDLLLTCEEAKKDLSRRETTQFAVNHAGERLTVQLTRPQLEEMTSDLLYRTECRVDRVVRQAGLTWNDMNEELLVGGSTRMPMVREMLRRMTGREPNASLSADEVVAHGAAIHGAILQVAPPLPLEEQVALSGQGGTIETLPPASAEEPEPIILEKLEEEDVRDLELVEPVPLPGQPLSPGAPGGREEPELVVLEGVDESSPRTLEAEEAPPLPGEQAGAERPPGGEVPEPIVLEGQTRVAAVAMPTGEPPPLPAEKAPPAPLPEGRVRRKRPVPFPVMRVDEPPPFDKEVSDLLHNVTAVNVNSHSLGVVVCSPYTAREYNSILIPRNTPLPAHGRKTYGTVIENQRLVRVRVTEGEAEDPTACILIGECIVSPLPADLPRGAPISVTFTYDNSGRLHVRAKDETSGLTAKSTIVRTSAMSRTELARARKAVSQMSIT